MNKSTIKQAFDLFESSLDDYRKILDVDYGGPAPNSVLSQIGLSITEPMAKTNYPYSNGSRSASMIDVSAKEASKVFFKEYFTNERYADLANIIWDTFRNGHVHLFQPKKIVGLDIGRFEDSFLAAVHYPGMTISEVEASQSDEDLQRSEHLHFYMITNKGIKRPVFRFSPMIYYLDLKEALSRYENRVESDSKHQEVFYKATNYWLIVKG